jgi:hypothetical protein
MKNLIASLIFFSIGILTLTGHIQKYIVFDNIINEVFFYLFCCMLGIGFLAFFINNIFIKIKTN